MKRLITLIWTVLALGIVLPVHAQQTDVTAADDAAKAEASKAYVDAMKAYEAGEHEKALEGFRHSYATVASPNSHLMIARSLQKLGRTDEALKEAKATVSEAEALVGSAPKYQVTLDSAQKMVEELGATMAFVRVSIVGGDLGPGMTLTVNGREVFDLAEPIQVEPGQVTAVLSNEHGSVEETVSVVGGGDALIELTPASPAGPDPENGDDEEGADTSFILRTSAIAAGGVGVVGMVLFGVFGGMTMSTFSDLEDRCPNDTCPLDADEDIDSGQTYRTVANVTLVIGITGLVAGATLFALDMFVLNPDEEAESAQLPVRMSVGPGSLTVTGQF